MVFTFHQPAVKTVSHTCAGAKQWHIPSAVLLITRVFIKGNGLSK